MKNLPLKAPTPGPRDIVVRPRACGICGSDAYYISIGGIPPRQGKTILGHEAAGEVVEVGAEVEGLSVGFSYPVVAYEDLWVRR